MAWRFHDRAEVDPETPMAFATCQRCGCQTNLYKLSNQQEWAGQSMISTNLLVCDRCLDKPNPQLRTLVLPPDPTPILNARPEPYSIDETDFRTVTDGAKRITESTDLPRVTESDTEQ